MTSSYDGAFYTRQREGSKRSARIILPIIFDLIKPQSIVDVGCGVGTWLSVASELGVGNLVGFEGNWVKDVRKEEGNFSVNFSDLERKIATADRFDLAMCLCIVSAITAIYRVVRVDPAIVLTR
jgi:ribosomal protein L11 methylase PrmA